MPSHERVSFYEDVIRRAQVWSSAASEPLPKNSAPLQNDTKGLSDTLTYSCEDFVKCLQTQYQLDDPSVDLPPVACILTFDEAQELAEEPKSPKNRSGFHNLGSVLKSISSYAVFSVFLSTNSNLWAIAPPIHSHPSLHKVPHPAQLHPPITELPFDLFARGLYTKLCQSNECSLSATCTVPVMACFGRTMWYSLHDQRQTSVINLAKAKLNPKKDEDEGAHLACLGIRIGLDFDASRETGRRKELQLVESHMRIVFAVPEHHEFMRTGTPSEPILAEAAAQLLNQSRSSLENLAPKVLCQAFEHGFLARGERGEMVGCLLWTLAHDKVLRGPQVGAVHFHRPISVIEFLRSLFHENHWPTILNARPVGNQEGPPLSDAFKEAYIHFSHFMDAGQHHVIKLQQVYRLLLRGAALNCRRNQPGIDF
ncbi:hypothetical protein PAXINDRAFT_12577 [Paxillus involutus ATCC 200175]|uniref:Uncharacterized protein n=1 Tax=Paxillus involutus ATCC 200175 TaxID=664439 RepID=A0A0C9SY23_PAXIN|nr:hypothetical protein PAXINDRAFT_12577 [Paxillus involutus ATCC 200175]